MLMKSTEIRQRFLDYFKSKGHEIVTSSPLVPANDPTLLFTNAGMVQFKDVFLGLDKRPYSRAASSQRCVRAGGKHNDLENVGYTARHHTFFEMLGNFSFGDYFKKEAIEYAWEFLTRDLGLPAEKFWVTVYKDDDESADIWLKDIGVDASRFSRLGDKDNFWSMGDTGPCGPCSEIFYDHGPGIEGGPPGTPEEDGDRYVEIWNLVFMQYDRDREGKLTPLPKPSVDTGMGLERVAAIMQGVHTNYDIDLFQNLIKASAKILGIKDKTSKSLNVIADHIRATAFLITDGVFPSNEGRGYVLRRIIRRAIRHGHQLGVQDIFFHKLVAPLVKEMGGAYPELKQAKANVEKVLRQEEERFVETLDNGLKILDQDIADMKGDTIPGKTIFQLYDTYGFPVDLTADIARERNLKMDMTGYDKEMAAQKERARAASSFEMDASSNFSIDAQTEFTGYETEKDGATVIALFDDEGEQHKKWSDETRDVIVVLDRTPFYAESGGQIGDTGIIGKAGGRLNVRTTKKLPAGAIYHICRLDGAGSIKIGDKVEVKVEQRQPTRLNHSATHLLHAALRKILGDHITQKGSLVDRAHLRFDFSHPQPVTPDQLAEIEAMVNEKIRANYEVETKEMGIEDAMKSGAMALFGEKYGDKVRVLRMGDFSVELCGGTHVSRTGDIGLFKIESESGVAAGVRRIEAVTGEDALGYMYKTEEQLNAIAGIVKSHREDVRDKVEQMSQRLRTTEKELEQLKAKLASSQGDSLTDQVIEVGGIKVLAAQLEGIAPKELRNTLDRLKDKLGSAAIVLATVEGGKVSLVAGVTKNLTQQLHAGELVNVVAEKVGGKGGGRPDMAQAGGDNPAALDSALQDVPKWVGQQLH